MMSTVSERLIALAAKRFKKDPAGIAAGDDIAEKLGIDSIQALDLLSELEMEFDVEIPDYELQEARTFGALAELIEKRQ